MGDTENREMSWGMLLVKGFDKRGSRRNAYKKCYQGGVVDLLCRMCCFFSVLFPWASQVVLEVKNPPASAGDVRDTGLIPGWGRPAGEGHGNPPEYFCVENPHGQRSLAGYSPWGHTESDMTEVA